MDQVDQHDHVALALWWTRTSRDDILLGDGRFIRLPADPECADVAVMDVEYSTTRALHEKYSIDAVPTVVIADSHGVAVATFLGPMTATDLWAAVAEAREPGSTPGGGSCQRDAAAAD